MSLGAGALKVGGARQQSCTGKEVSMATLRAATTNGTVTLNPISGILIRPDTYQTEGGDGGRGGGLDNTAGKNDLSRRPASKQMQCEPWGPLPAGNTKVAPEPRQEATADRH